MNESHERVTVIIPYNKDRGWLQDAIDSVPEGVQLILSKGEGNWPQNFNDVLYLAKDEFIRWLHEDDKLTPNCIEDSVRAIEEQSVDFIHGNAMEVFEGKVGWRIYKPSIIKPTLEDLLKRNVLHSATLMYKKEIFERIGSFDTTLNLMEEYEFNLRCLKAGFKIGYCNAPLAIYRRHSEQKVRIATKEEKSKEKELVNSKYLL
jgi:GT2 family glycosyltransferase